MKNLLSRLGTALVALPLMVALLYRVPWWGFGTLAGAAQFVAAWEFFALSHKDDKVGQYFGAALSTALFLLLTLTRFGLEQPQLVLFGVLAVSPVAMLFTLVRAEPQATSLTRMAALTLGPLYIGGSLAALAVLRRTHAPGQDWLGAGWIVLALALSWFSDTGGYFFGKGLKGPKLYPSVSPNKTWAGALGGLVGGALGALAAHYWYLPTLPLGMGLAVCLFATAFGQAGDFCESLMKRAVGVKDSGGLLPGHGGMLDRLDATMFVAVALLAAVRAGLLPG